MITNDESWRERYKKSGQREFVETVEYVPCPSSSRCGIVTMQADGDSKPDDGPTWPYIREYQAGSV